MSLTGFLRHAKAPLAAAAAALVLLHLSGCSYFSSKNLDPRKNWTAEQYYSDAHDSLKEGNYDAAIKTYAQLESRYPYGRYAQQAQLDTAYAYYKQGNTEEAVAGCDRF